MRVSLTVTRVTAIHLSTFAPIDNSGSFVLVNIFCSFLFGYKMVNFIFLVISTLFSKSSSSFINFPIYLSFL